MEEKKQVVMITGASAGLGRSIARAYGRQKAYIGLIARGITGLQAAKNEIEEMGGHAMIFPLDVANAQAVDEAAIALKERFGPIDIWINNAMVSVFSPVHEMQPEEYKRVTEVTYLGQVYGAQSALKQMIPRDKGSIVFVGSALAYRGIPLQSAYCAAKHAILGFFESLRTELLHNKSNIHVSMVQLPAMNTPQFRWVRSRLTHKSRPMGKIYDPNFIAESILYAASHKRREILVGCSTVEAVVGNKIAPWYAARVLASKGFQGQQIADTELSERPDNLFQALDQEEDWGAHGVFDKLQHESSIQYWMTTHRLAVRLGLAAIVAGFIMAIKKR